MAPNKTEAVQVIVRCRPENEKEKREGRNRIVTVDPDVANIAVANPETPHEPPKTFSYDKTFDSNSKQIDVYNQVARPLVEAVLNGYNGTIFAYGQTGCGKTFTMLGKDSPPELQGIIPNAFSHLFSEIAKGQGKDYLVRASFLEIYNEDVRDLLSKANTSEKLEVKEHPDKGVYVKDLTQYVVKTIKECQELLEEGNKNRTVGATLMNQDSSRSHSIFTITVEILDVLEGPGGAPNPNDKENGHVRVGKLNLVDLAGSERQSKTGATGQRLKEATKINLSLSALGNVISALADGKGGHIPYRDSKLTRLLQDSLGGNTKTVMIANVSPADYNYDETLSTLRYASRAKFIQNKPRINEDPKDAMIRQFRDEIEQLKAKLAAKQRVKTAGPGGASGGAGGKIEGLEELREQIRRELEARLKAGANADSIEQTRMNLESNARHQLEAMAGGQAKLTPDQQAKIDEQTAELARYAAKLEAEHRDRMELEQKIKDMKARLLGGGEMEQKMEELMAWERKADEALAASEAHAAEVQQRIQQLEQDQKDLQGKMANAQDSIKQLTKRLKRSYNTYLARKAEVEDVQKSFQGERQELLDDIRTLTKEIKLLDCIINAAIPADYLATIMQHATYDDADEKWLIDHEELTGRNIVNGTMAAQTAKQQAQDLRPKTPGGEEASPKSPGRTMTSAATFKQTLGAAPVSRSMTAKNMGVASAPAAASGMPSLNKTATAKSIKY